ncbi:uncharacterized protein VTP21DRAFT_9444 [Calcarisporiella thermophila]|uniref:uncharacterized protein n=1 Tax=Calcarisporiella thermophila TaxID=911321 RepID=UPI0037430A32
MEQRFLQSRNIGGLSKWIRERIMRFEGFESAMSNLSDFMSTRVAASDIYESPGTLKRISPEIDNEISAISSGAINGSRISNGSTPTDISVGAPCIEINKTSLNSTENGNLSYVANPSSADAIPRSANLDRFKNQSRPSSSQTNTIISRSVTQLTPAHQQHISIESNRDQLTLLYRPRKKVHCVHCNGELLRATFSSQIFCDLTGRPYALSILARQSKQAIEIAEASIYQANPRFLRITQSNQPLSVMWCAEDGLCYETLSCPCNRILGLRVVAASNEMDIDLIGRVWLSSFDTYFRDDDEQEKKKRRL